MSRIDRIDLNVVEPQWSPYVQSVKISDTGLMKSMMNLSSLSG